MESGLPVPGDLERNQYESIKKLVDPEIIDRKIKEIYGDEIQLDNYHKFDNVKSDKERVSKQFCYVHKIAKSEQEKSRKNDKVKVSSWYKLRCK